MRSRNSTIFKIDPTQEHATLEWDKKSLTGRGKNRTVKNKNCRHNLCYADFSQEHEYEKGKGHIVDFAAILLLSKVRKVIG